MKGRHVVGSAILLATLASGMDARADGFRCPNKQLVSVGDFLSDVVVKCDEPTFKQQRTETEAGLPNQPLVVVQVEEWTYNQGPHEFVYTLVFRNGVLAQVRRGSYGR